MSQFDVYRLSDGTLVIDLQSDLFDNGMRTIAPLRPLDDAPRALPRLNPVLDVDGAPHMLRMEGLVVVMESVLRSEPLANLSHEYDAIRDAFDFLFHGY